MSRFTVQVMGQSLHVDAWEKEVTELEKKIDAFQRSLNFAEAQWKETKELLDLERAYVRKVLEAHTKLLRMVDVTLTTTRFWD